MFFLIWTLVTGFFGQNFGYLTEHIDSKAAFFGYEIGALLIPSVDPRRPAVPQARRLVVIRQ